MLIGNFFFRNSWLDFEPFKYFPSISSILHQGISPSNFVGLSRWGTINELHINFKCTHSQLSGISNGFSSSEIGVSSRSFFLSFPSFTSLAFSLRILSSNTDAGSSLGSCGTKRPSIASCRMLFFNRSGSSSFNLSSASCALPYSSTFGNNSSIFATMRFCSARGGEEPMKLQLYQSLDSELQRLQPYHKTVYERNS